MSSSVPGKVMTPIRTALITFGVIAGAPSSPRSPGWPAAHPRSDAEFRRRHRHQRQARNACPGAHRAPRAPPNEATRARSPAPADRGFRVSGRRRRPLAARIEATRAAPARGTMAIVQIVHLGQSCVLVETGAARLLLDPGVYSTGFAELTELDAILVTHQHPDHLDLERLPALLAANPAAGLLVDAGSAPMLVDAGLPHRVVGAGQR